MNECASMDFSFIHTNEYCKRPYGYSRNGSIKQNFRGLFYIALFLERFEHFSFKMVQWWLLFKSWCIWLTIHALLCMWKLEALKENPHVNSCHLCIWATQPLTLKLKFCCTYTLCTTERSTVAISHTWEKYTLMLFLSYSQNVCVCEIHAFTRSFSDNTISDKRIRSTFS